MGRVTDVECATEENDISAPVVSIVDVEAAFETLTKATKEIMLAITGMCQAVIDCCPDRRVVHLEHTAKVEWDDSILIDASSCRDGSELYSPRGILSLTVKALNTYRTRYLETKDKKYWWQMIQLLPSSYNQKRTVMLNYEVLANMYKSRKNHKLTEWHDFCDWIRELPYSELITGEFDKEETK